MPSEVFGNVATYYKQGNYHELSEKILSNVNMNDDRLSSKTAKSDQNYFLGIFVWRELLPS